MQSADVALFFPSVYGLQELEIHGLEEEYR